MRKELHSMKNYKIKVFIKRKRFALLTIYCETKQMQEIVSQLNSNTTFIKFVSVIINKKEIQHVTIKQIKTTNLG